MAHCTSTNAATPGDCTDGWEFLGQSNGEYVWIVDGNVEVTTGRCPQVKTIIHFITKYIHSLNYAIFSWIVQSL